MWKQVEAAEQWVGWRRQEGVEPGIRAIMEATRELAEAVYGSQSAMQRAGYEPAPPDEIGCSSAHPACLCADCSCKHLVQASRADFSV